MFDNQRAIDVINSMVNVSSYREALSAINQYFGETKVDLVSFFETQKLSGIRDFLLRDNKAVIGFLTILCHRLKCNGTDPKTEVGNYLSTLYDNIEEQLLEEEYSFLINTQSPYTTLEACLFMYVAINNNLTKMEAKK